MAESPEPLFEEGCHLAWKMRENLTSATSGFFVFFFYCLGIKISVHVGPCFSVPTTGDRAKSSLSVWINVFSLHIFFLCFFSCNCVENFGCIWSEILGFERDLAGPAQFFK